MATMVMPRLGETVTEGTIVRWLKKEGEPVAKDEMIVEVSTDKVDTELPAPISGRLAKILVPEGEKVPVGTELAAIEDHEAAVREAPPRPEAAKPEAAPALVPPPEKPAPAVEKEAPPAGVVTPLVRRLAREHNVDLSKVKGTGAGGRITKADVMVYVEETRAKPEVAPPAPPKKVDREEIVPLGHVRKMIAEHMVRSRRTSAHVTAIIEADMTNIVRLRSRVKESFKAKEGFSLTYMPFVARALIDALQYFPTLNSSLTDDSLVLKKYINLGIAVAYEEGLIVPVVKGADTMNLVGLARAIHDVAERARARRLQPDEVHEGTFTLTNPGVFGSIIQTPIINQPQVGILSLEAITRRPVVIDDAIAIRDMVNLCLSYDHRVVDGAIAAQFLSRVKHNLETWDFAPELGIPTSG